jgi:hypothetical protein
MFVLALAGCGRYEIQEYETGYKGPARLNPWLAAERFTARYGHRVLSLKTWREPAWDDAVWFAPASVLGNASYVRKAGDWVRDGGHLVVLLERAGAEISDWRMFGTEVELPAPLVELLASADIAVAERKNRAEETHQVEFEGREFRLHGGGGKEVSAAEGPPGIFASARLGDGRISAVADAGMFRNRWIDEHDHAAFLLALIDAADFEGSVLFSRGASLSFWHMLKTYLWPVLIGLLATLAVWLWKNLPRFGPLEAAEPPSPARGYDHQLAAVGSYHWRADRATVLLAPLRERIVEHGLRHGQHAGRPPEDWHAWLAERAGLPPERVAAALAPTKPADAAALVRVTADLQTLLRFIH